MAFTWNIIDLTEDISIDDYQEIKDNIDTVAGKLPTNPGNYSWIYNPSQEDEILYEYTQELRDAADWLDDNNVCNNYNSDYDSGVDGAHDYGVDSGQYSGRDSSQHGTVNSSDFASHNVGK